MSVVDHAGLAKTAFVFAGGGSFGAIQVGMMHSLAAHGISADMVVGSSVGALNGAYYAGDPTLNGILQLETIWRGLHRHDVFPVTWRTLLGFIWRRDFLIPHDGIQKLIDDHLPYRNLLDAKLPVHIVTTDIVSGDSVVLSEGSAAEAIIASTAIPGAFAPVRYKDFYLADGAISSNTPIRVAVAKGANRLIILPTGYACATHAPPTGAVANALHALTLLIARQLVSELEGLGPGIEYFVVPPLCPLVGSPYDFSRTSDHIERAIQSTDAWLLAWRSAGFPTRCVRILTERDPARPRCTAKRRAANGIADYRRIDSRPRDSVTSRPPIVISMTVAPDIVYRIVLGVGLGCGRQE